MNQNANSLRVVEQDLTPEKRTEHMTIAVTHSEKQYIEKDLYLSMRRLVSPSTLACYLLRDGIARVSEGEISIQDLCDKRCQSPLSDTGHTSAIQFGVIITSQMLADIQRIQNMRGTYHRIESSQQEVLERVWKEGLRAVEAKQGQFMDEAAQDEAHAAPTFLASINSPNDRQHRKESNEG